MNAIRCAQRAAALVLFLPTGATIAQTITVDISDASAIDVDSFTATLADLPGPDGHVSFSEALIASNNTPGQQAIGFAIPTSDWTYLAWYYPGRAVIHGGFGFQATDPVTIDGTTQTAFTGDTNPDGGEVVVFGPLYLNADGCTVVGLDSSTVSFTADNGLAQGNTQTGIELFGGSGSLVKDNTGGYVQIDRSSDNVVVGNTVQRVRVLGWVGGGQPAINNRIGGPSPAERNHITGLGTLNSQGIPAGFAVQLFDSIGTVLENNWIGTTPDGMQSGHPWTTAGISFQSENHGAIVRDNRIAGILALAVPPLGPDFHVGSAIVFLGTGSDVSIVGNKIGLNANDEPVLGSVTGIDTANYYLGTVQGLVIGGSAAGNGNEIAGHKGSGIRVANAYSGVRITGNSIHDNGGLGIDLVTDGLQTGVTPNDPLDTDSGGNGLQNFPVLQSAVSTGSSLHVVGTLNSTPSSGFTIELFASPLRDVSGFGEGQDYLGSATVTTNASGNASIDATLPAAVPAGWFVSATATHAATGSTSEFAACVDATGSAWIDLGQGLAGTSGVPTLVGSGALIPATPINWSLTGAKSTAPAWFVVGLSQVHLPTVGGILVPFPDLVLPAPTDALGAASLAVQLGSPLPSGQQVSVQAWLVDPAGPLGWAASNAIAATAP